VCRQAGKGSCQSPGVVTLNLWVTSQKSQRLLATAFIRRDTVSINTHDRMNAAVQLTSHKGIRCTTQIEQ